jgi:hypothetical protein
MRFALSFAKPRSLRSISMLLLAVAMLLGGSTGASALIEGGEGNDPIRDPGWPVGAAGIVNFKGRVAYWVGPPFGGGQWHAECRGDADDLNAILQAFALVDSKNKKVIVHDGNGKSFWLNTNDDPAKRDAAKIDWVFTVWQKESFERLLKMPADLHRIDKDDAKLGPPLTLEIYTGGSVKWKDVLMPKGLTVIDKRLEAHGYQLSDGIVLEGKLVDVETKKPVHGKVRLEKVEPQKEGGYAYPTVHEVESDAKGRWVVKNAPEGWIRIVAVAKGYVSRVIGHERLGKEPRWASYECGLICPAPVTGRVTDAEGKPLADVEVRFGNVVAKVIGRYESSDEGSVKTDANGRFRAENLPKGTATVWVTKPGYVRPGLGPNITTPTQDVKLEMVKSASLVVTIDFSAATRPGGYIVMIDPEGGGGVGTWGGSGSIDPKDQIKFEHIPPGKYVLKGRPNPGSTDQETESLTVDLKGGDEQKVTLKAK